MGRRPRSRPGGPVGLLVVDKPAGVTSHDVVAEARRRLGERRIGHAGTLDPPATGVLLVGVGRFTRALRFLTGMRKAYTAEVVLGVTTSTLDDTGEVTGRFDMGPADLDAARAAAAELTGPIEQMPPMVSAVKVGGRRLHELARAGEEVERAARTVTVHRFEVAAADRPDVLRIEVVCSAGTYVRSLADDLGRALGGGAHLRSLRRTAVGSFSLAEAGPVADAPLLGPVEALRDLGRVDVGPGLSARIAHGAVLDAAELPAEGEPPWLVVDHDGEALAVYEPVGERRKPALVLRPGGGGSGPTVLRPGGGG